MSLRSIACAALFAGASLGCSVPNTDHCGNLQGDKTCQLRDPKMPYCSLCVADNNGCSATPIEDDVCHMASDSGVPVNSTTGGTSTGTPGTSTSAVDPTTTGTTDATTTTGTTDATTTTTGTTDATTTSTGSTTAETTWATTETGATTAETTVGETADTVDMTTAVPETCGNGVLDEGEPCDGGKLGGKTCADFAGYGGGTLKCLDVCDYDKSGCCLAIGQKCSDGGTPCCPGSSCKMTALLTWTCADD